MEKELIELVITEAINLKTNATSDELSRLDINFLEADNMVKCIYGQMTGNCFSQRSDLLITECAERVYCIDQSEKDNYFNSLTLNGPPSKRGGRFSFKYYSPIEYYISLGLNNKALIQFLKSEITEIEFTNALRNL